MWRRPTWNSVKQLHEHTHTVSKTHQHTHIEFIIQHHWPCPLAHSSYKHRRWKGSVHLWSIPSWPKHWDGCLISNYRSENTRSASEWERGSLTHRLPPVKTLSNQRQRHAFFIPVLISTSSLALRVGFMGFLSSSTPRKMPDKVHRTGLSHSKLGFWDMWIKEKGCVTFESPNCRSAWGDTRCSAVLLYAPSVALNLTQTYNWGYYNVIDFQGLNDACMHEKPWINIILIRMCKFIIFSLSSMVLNRKQMYSGTSGIPYCNEFSIMWSKSSSSKVIFQAAIFTFSTEESTAVLLQ